LADIRHKTGVSDKPSLTELADAVAAKIPHWQPIATAPRDGTRILLYMPGKIASVYEGWLNELYMKLDSRGGNPTHWMPLPEEPARGD